MPSHRRTLIQLIPLAVLAAMAAVSIVGLLVVGDSNGDAFVGFACLGLVAALGGLVFGIIRAVTTDG